ncbi:oligosaccharide flippase family protein, partial [uncultured Muribaculum sp.]
MDNTLVHKTATGAIWATIDRFGNMALQFIVNLVLARLLMPDDFGAIGMLAIFIAVSQVIIDGGFGNALIQKKNPSQTDYSTIFYWNIGLSTVMYSLLYAFSPYIAIYFKMPILSDVLRAIGLILITTSIISIQTVRLRKQLAFKTIAITNLGSYIT